MSGRTHAVPVRLAAVTIAIAAVVAPWQEMYCTLHEAEARLGSDNERAAANALLRTSLRTALQLGAGSLTKQVRRTAHRALSPP